jgi:hypothetical protein
MIDMQEQARLVTEAARSLVAVAPEGWTALHYTAHMVRGEQRSRLWVDLPEGRKGIHERDTMVYMRQLRTAMYEPGKGTFYSAKIDVTAADGSVQTHFEYDEEPQIEVHPAQFAADLEQFPRDDEHIPAWLRQRVSEADTPPELWAIIPDLEDVGNELFARMPGDAAPTETSMLPDGLGILMARQSRGGGKLFIAPDRSLMFSPSAESVEQGLERFRAGERWQPAGE